MLRLDEFRDFFRRDRSTSRLPTGAPVQPMVAKLSPSDPPARLVPSSNAQPTLLVQVAVWQGTTPARRMAMVTEYINRAAAAPKPHALAWFIGARSLLERVTNDGGPEMSPAVVRLWWQTTLLALRCGLPRDAEALWERATCAGTAAPPSELLAQFNFRLIPNVQTIGWLVQRLRDAGDAPGARSMIDGLLQVQEELKPGALPRA